MTKRQWGIAAVVVAVACGGLAFWILSGGDEGEPTALPAPATDAPEVQAPVEEAAPADVVEEPPLTDEAELDLDDDDLSLDEITPSSLADKDSLGILTLEPQALENPPESVKIVTKAVAGNILVYGGAMQKCTPDGEPLTGQRGVLVDVDPFEVKVVDVDPETGNYVLEKKSGVTALIKRADGTTELWTPSDESIEHSTISPNNELLKLEVDGREVSRLVKGNIDEDLSALPRLVWPDEEIRPGAVWKTEAKGNSANFIEGKLVGFAEVLGHKCAVIETREVISISWHKELDEKGFDSRIKFIRTGKIYVDYESGLEVRNDWIGSYEVSLRPKGTDKPFEPMPQSEVECERHVIQLMRIKEGPK